MVRPQQRTMLVLVDYDNIASNVKVPREELGDWVMNFIRLLGQVRMAEIVVDVRRLSEEMVLGLQAAGFCVLHSPKTGVFGQGRPKDSVDPALIERLHRYLDCLDPALTTIVLGSGDRDFLPVMITCRNLGKEVIVLGHGGVARILRESADKVIDLRTNVQLSINSFRRFLVNSSFTDYDGLDRPDIVRLRDGLATYVRWVQREYVLAEKHWMTRTFLQRGLSKVRQFIALNEIEVAGLADLMIDTILEPRQDVEGRFYAFNYHHPFLSYALANHDPYPTPASS